MIGDSLNNSIKGEQHYEYKSPIFGMRYIHLLKIQKIIELIRVIINFNFNNRNPIKLMDVGCGDGYLLKEIAIQFPQINLFGVDLSQSRVETAKKFVPTAMLETGDAQNIPFGEETFDVVVCSEVIEHCPNDLKVLAELYRISKSNSFLILTAPNLYTLESISKALIGRRIVPPSYHLREYSYYQLIRKMREAGFKVLKFQCIGFYIPKMSLFFRSRFATTFLFSLAKLLPKHARTFIFLAKKYELLQPCETIVP